MDENKVLIDTSKWELSTNRLIGFIDIMGFKDMVARRNVHQLLKMMERIRFSVFQNMIIHGNGSMDENRYESDLNIVMFSDSIVVFSKDLSEDSISHFINALAGLTNDLIRKQVPFKGAVSAGMMTVNFEKSIYFGQPLIDAYSLHDELGFYGVVVHATADSILRQSSNSHVFEYDCPFKSGTARHLTVLPEMLETDLFNNDNYLNYYQAIEELRVSTSGILRIYIDRTLKYFDTLRNNCKEIID